MALAFCLTFHRIIKSTYKKVLKYQQHYNIIWFVLTNKGYFWKEVTYGNSN